MLKKSILLLFISPALVLGQQKDSNAVRYSKLITASEMSRNLHVLASDEYEGRETGKKGQKMAAEYIAKEFAAAGIPPYKESTYYQQFPLNVILPSPAQITVKGKQFEGNRDYYSFPGQTEQDVEIKDVLFLGYGIEEDTYNDYKGVDVKGKTLMIMAGEPFSKDSLSLINGKKEPSLWTGYYKLKPEKAREKGVGILLIVSDDIQKGINSNRHKLESPSMKLDLNKKEMPVIYISKEMANSILGKRNIEGIKKRDLPGR